MASPCSTLIVDDDDDMSFLVRTTLEVADEGLTIAGIASSAEEALQQLPAAAPDVVVLDYRMPGRNGLELAADILEIVPGQSIVLFSAYLDDQTVAEAERLGIRQCVSKDDVRSLPGIIRKFCPGV